MATKNQTKPACPGLISQTLGECFIIQNGTANRKQAVFYDLTVTVKSLTVNLWNLTVKFPNLTVKFWRRANKFWNLTVKFLNLTVRFVGSTVNARSVTYDNQL